MHQAITGEDHTNHHRRNWTNHHRRKYASSYHRRRSHKSSQEKICNMKGSVAFLKDSTMKFENYKNIWHLPFIIYADFKCIVEKADSVDQDAVAGKGL